MARFARNAWLLDELCTGRFAVLRVVTTEADINRPAYIE
jgi:hypothetical protein